MEFALSDNSILTTNALEYQQAELTRQHRHQFLLAAIAALTDVLTIAITLAVGFLLIANFKTRTSIDCAAWAAQATLVAVMFAALGTGIITALSIRGHYGRFMPSLAALRQVYGVCGFAFLVSCPVMLWTQAPPLWHLLSGVWLIVPVTVLNGRLLVNSCLRRFGLEPVRVLIAGNPSALERLRSVVRSDRYGGYGVVAQLDLAAIQMRDKLSAQTVSSFLHQQMRSAGASFLIISLKDCDDHLREKIISALGRETIPYAIEPNFGGLPVHGCNTYYYMSHDCMMLSFKNNFQGPFARTLKGVFDRVVALCLLALGLPVFVLVALAVVTDGGPVLYRQVRIGQHGRPFLCLKFRSMYRDADKYIGHLLATDQQAAGDWARNQKLLKDPRVTPIGRLLRSTSLDELPQLLNVLRGDMSLVGPRPVVDAELARYGSDLDLYMRVKPGITGLWQVSGRSETTYARRVMLDAWYVKNWSLWHDLAILLRTIPTLLARRGAV